MKLALDCPETLLRLRVKRILIGETCMWEDISAERLSQGQYRIIGHGVDKKVGSGAMSWENALALVVNEILAQHRKHLEEAQQTREWAAVLATWCAAHKCRKANISSAQLPLWREAI